MQTRQYSMTWEWSCDSYFKTKRFGLNCELARHRTIKGFEFWIQEEEGQTKYRFRMQTITDRTGCRDSLAYNEGKTLAIQKSVTSEFEKRHLRLNTWSSDIYSDLVDHTKESAMACASVLFTMINLSQEDQKKILDFLKTGVLQQQQVFEILFTLISENKKTEALDKALLLEKNGYNGILLTMLVECLGNGDNIELNTSILNMMLEHNVSLNVIEYLLTLEINWAYLNEEGRPLILTAFLSSPTAIHLLVKAGADINQIDKYGLTLMHIIAYLDVSNQQLAKLKSLFDCGANPTIRAPQSNMTPYQAAYIKQNYIIAQHIAEYTKQFKGYIEPHNTIEAQLEQIRNCQEREKPQRKLSQKKILARLQESKMAQQEDKFSNSNVDDEVKVAAPDISHSSEEFAVGPGDFNSSDKFTSVPRLAKATQGRKDEESVEGPENSSSLTKSCVVGSTQIKSSFWCKPSKTTVLTACVGAVTLATAVGISYLNKMR